MSPEEIAKKLEAYSQVDVKSGCREWTGGKDKRGYGRMATGGGKKVSAHRLSFQVHNQCDVPDHLQIMHTCDNRACINPDHLVMGNHKANMHDMKVKERAASGSKHPSSKLTEEDVINIRFLGRLGWASEDIGVIFGISRSTARKVVTGETYKQGHKKCH